MTVFVENPNGTFTTTLNLTTTIKNKFLNGTMPQDIISFQVSINGGAFSEEPVLSQWGDGEWVIPNPIYEPSGLILLEGVNTVKCRGITPSGGSTNIVEITLVLVSTDNVGSVAQPPTNISLTQKNNSVEISAEPLISENLIGFNFYASLFSGGGVGGYQRINVNTIRDGVATEEFITFANSETQTNVATDVEGNQLSDPQYVRLTSDQESVSENVLQADYNEKFEIPESAKEIKLSVSLQQVRETIKYTFDHNRTFGPTSATPTVAIGDFTATPPNTPLYYVVTALYFNADTNTEYESSFSQEIVGHPIIVTSAVGSFPTTTRQNIVQEYITAIFRSNPQIKVEAGSVLRDTVIDPFASEVERVRFLLDFYHRARTPTLLLQVDDPNGTGVSIPVSQSAYKQGLQQALYLESAQNVQNLIDNCFDAYASNFGVTRRSGEFAKGEVLFFVTARPSNSILIPLGTVVSGGGVDFVTTRASSISLQNLASFFNPITGRYQVRVPVKALESGTQGNLGVGQLSRVASNLGNKLKVINEISMIGGRGTESNLELTERVLRTLASVDSGTEQGYINTAADVPGVIKVNVVSAGNPLMQRDLNENLEHKGGKVDVWVQGDLDTSVTDTFAFTFEIGKDISFDVVGDPTNYILRSSDPTLSVENPIVEIIDGIVGYEFINATTGELFDLTNVQYLNYNTIQLDISVAQPTLDLTDIVLGSYRKRVGNEFVLLRQPVGGITKVEGTISGELPSNAYNLIRRFDPLNLGRSSLAQDYLQVIGYVNDNGDRVPSGDPITVADEEHVLIGTYFSNLDNLGINFLTIKVYNQDKTILYKGPNDPSGNPDYQINVGTDTQPVSIARLESGQITSGQTVVVDYEHDENFVVTYTTDVVVSLVQDEINAKKHATADVIVKKAIPVPVDIQATIIYVRGRDVSTIDQTLRTNLENFFNNLRLGVAVRQSDIIRVIENTSGVSFVEIPLTRMGRQNGSTVTREQVSTDIASESTLMSSLTSNIALVYLLNNPLSSSTSDGGGDVNEFRGVFQSDKELTLLPSGSNLENLGLTIGNSYIIGFNGVSIQGFSDDQTLIAQGYLTPSEILQRRKELTANRILVSLGINDNPSNYLYTVSYVVENNTGVANIDASDIEYCVSGEIVITYTEDNK